MRTIGEFGLQFHILAFAELKEFRCSEMLRGQKAVVDLSASGRATLSGF